MACASHPLPRVTQTPAFSQRTNYVAERCTPRYYRILTNYPYTQALSVLSLKAPAGHSRPPSSTWYHRAGSPREAPLLWTGTADRDLCSHAGMPLRASDSEILVVISGSGSQEPAAMRLCALLVHSLV